jgi:molybdenum-dependent DNA-binding transcriptional regulator ModE
MYVLQGTPNPIVPEPWLSIIGGGLAAAIVTIIFSVLWDGHKQKLAEDWEFKKYHVNIIHFAMVGLMEAFFAAKAEMYYLTSTLESLLATLNQLAGQADQIVRQQGGPELTVAVLEQRKQALLEPFKKFNQEQVNLRWGHYEQKAKESHAKAEMHLAALKTLVPAQLYDELVALFVKLSAPFVWDLVHGKEKLGILEGSVPEVLAVRAKLMDEIENKLGRQKQKNVPA